MKPRQRNAPLRSSDEVKWNYQASFLYYFQERNPKASEELLALDELYLKVFDEHMPPHHNKWESRRDKWRDADSSGALYLIRETYFRPHKRGVQYINDRYFTLFNEKLKKVWDEYDIFKKIIADLLKRFLASGVDGEGQRVAPSEIYVSLWGYFKHKSEKNENFKQLAESDDKVYFSRAVNEIIGELVSSHEGASYFAGWIKPIEQFSDDLEALSEGFFEWLDRYHFAATDWLCELAFRALCQGTGKLEIEPQLLASAILPPTQPLPEPPHWPIRRDSQRFHYPPEPFSFSEQFNYWDNSQEYEERAVSAFREHIRDYTAGLKKEFSAAGYKKPRKPIEYPRVAWLVLWNKYASPDLQAICNDIDELMRERNAEKRFCRLKKPKSDDALRKALTKFKKYDLPVRGSNIESGAEFIQAEKQPE